MRNKRDIFKKIWVISFCLICSFIFHNALAESIDISTCEELRDISLTGDYKLINNIDCSDTVNWNEGLGWDPLGEFFGTLDGQGFSINGLYINRPLENYVGLFSKTKTCSVSNLSLINVNITGNQNIGSLTGYDWVSSFENITISGTVKSEGVEYSLGGLLGEAVGSSLENCSSSGSVISENGEGVYAGGLVGSINEGTVSNCSSSSNVSGGWWSGGLIGISVSSISNSWASGNVSGASGGSGGLAGALEESFILNSWASGNVSDSEDTYIGLGGLVLTNNGGEILNSWATGEINSISNNVAYVGGLVGYNNGGSISNSWASGGIVAKKDNIGGLVGENFSGSSIVDSYSIGGSVASVGNNVGGLVGKNMGGTVQKSYSTKNVSGNDGVGGLIGANGGLDQWEMYVVGSVFNSYSSGDVIVNNGSELCGGGGFVGFVLGTISNSYSTGSVTGNGSFNGFAGNGDPSSISNSYWDVSSSDLGSSGDSNLGAVGKNTNEMKLIDTFVGWNMSNELDYSMATVWYINDDYPKLYFPIVETLSVIEDDITSNSVVLRGDLKDYYGVNVYFQYRKIGEVWETTSLQLKNSLGNFSQEVENLSANTTYEFRAVVKYDSNISYGEILSFSTTEDAPVLLSIAITTPADVLSYNIGSELDITGLEITGTYSDDSTCVESITLDNISGFDSSVAETDQVLTITISGVSVTYNINILANKKSSSRFISLKNPEIIIDNVENEKELKEGFIVKGRVITYSSYPDKIEIDLNGVVYSPDFLKCTNQMCNWEYTLPNLENKNVLSFVVYDQAGLSGMVSFEIDIKEQEEKNINVEVKQNNKESVVDEQVIEKEDVLNEKVYSAVLNQIIALLQQILSFYK